MPQSLEERLLYRDGMMLILDKPPGIPVHAGPKGGPNLEDGLDELRFGLPRRPGLAHRLDRDTSGCLILGRHPKALRKLGELFTAGRIEKTYWAVVLGSPPAGEGTIYIPLIKKSRDKRSWWMRAATASDNPTDVQHSITGYKVLGRAADDALAWVAFYPKTGRTHQIRVHAVDGLGCPIVGEPLYGDLAQIWRDLPLHLHAQAITVPLYPNKPAIATTAPAPAHMQELLARCGWSVSA